MNKIPDSIPKQPELRPAFDFYQLRREGIGFIEQLGSSLWTDYNTHDPGITILESLCYAITDLAYRSGWQIADLLAPASPPSDSKNPFPNQAFFTARDILTVNPVTPDDFRRLLIDLAPIRNAWVFCKECACDFCYFAWCKDGQLQLGYQKPTGNLPAIQVEPQGLYDILLELEDDPEWGDLNNRKVGHFYSVFDSDGEPHQVTLEMRFPAWELAAPLQWTLFHDDNDAFLGQNGKSFTLKVARFGATKTFDLLTDPALKNAGERDQYLRNHWRDLFYVSFDIEIQPSGNKIRIENASLRIDGDSFAKQQATAADMKTLFENKTPAGFIQRYRNKLLTAEKAVNAAKSALQHHRNLDEDYCHIKIVDIEEVTVCADIEVKSDADIERVQAEIWFIIEQYCSPHVPFYSLQELLDSDTPVEDIFNGPALSNGFIQSTDLQSTRLKSVLRTSDLINSLMDIDGIIAVNHLLLSKYDQEGNTIKGAADPTWASDGSPQFDSNKTSAAWLLYISPYTQPRFHRDLSRFLFFKNGLPFLPRKDEAYDTLIQLRGEGERPKLKSTQNDLPIPKGLFRDPEAYFPLQYALPSVYGVGPEGLPSNASNQRKAQARQLQAYLMVFEQLLANAFAQIGHCADLFSLDPAITRTYFVKKLSESVIKGYDDLLKGTMSGALLAMTETPVEFQERRNRFLDHLMSRFGEQFAEYALLLSRTQSQQTASTRLIEDKISFLTAYPGISHDRGKAFNYTLPLSLGNTPGIKNRVSLLLGFPNLAFQWQSAGPDGGPYLLTYQLKDSLQKGYFSGNLTLATDSSEIAQQQAFTLLLAAFSKPEAYGIIAEGKQFRLTLSDADKNPLGQSALFASQDEATSLKTELLAWGANARAVVVEHLLLRPKFPGDALYPVCASGDCMTCGDEDPYSFRLTWVMPGWSAPYNDNLEMRGFADRTIRKEMPAHLLSKICWVGNDGFVENPCDPVVNQLAEWLLSQALTADSKKLDPTQACACAIAIYGRFSASFKAWYQDKTLVNFHADSLAIELQKLFSALDSNGLACEAVIGNALWQEIAALLLTYFQQIALNGWQFERFELAWRQWQEANAKIDWLQEHLPEQVQAILAANLLNGPSASLCQCGTRILTAYGMAFQEWLYGNILAAKPLTALSPFQPPAIILHEEAPGPAPTFCTNLTFKTGTGSMLQSLLDQRYTAYREVSYHLWWVVTLLSKLRNTYPDATLHDCDDGSDQNPVRLGSTALGSQHTRQPSATL